MKFDKTKANIDCYNKNSYMEYLNSWRLSQFLLRLLGTLII
jgi:hypothetical protein